MWRYKVYVSVWFIYVGWCRMWENLVDGFFLLKFVGRVEIVFVFLLFYVVGVWRVNCFIGVDWFVGNYCWLF